MRGRNHYPQDIELTVGAQPPGAAARLRRGLLASTSTARSGWSSCRKLERRGRPDAGDDRRGDPARRRARSTR